MAVAKKETIKKDEKIIEEKIEVVVDNEKQILLDMIKDLQKQMSELSKDKNIKPIKSEKNTIELEDGITVISQCVGGLNLLNGEYEFKEFGEIQEIPFEDLRKIVRVHRSFAENGLFYIVNDFVVKKLKLERYYTRLLNVEDMNNLFKLDCESVIELYNLSHENQKNVIVERVIDKKLKGENIDANILVQLGKLCGKNLLEIETE